MSSLIRMTIATVNKLSWWHIVTSIPYSKYITSPSLQFMGFTYVISLASYNNVVISVSQNYFIALNAFIFCQYTIDYMFTLSLAFSWQQCFNFCRWTKGVKCALSLHSLPHLCIMVSNHNYKEETFWLIEMEHFPENLKLSDMSNFKKIQTHLLQKLYIFHRENNCPTGNIITFPSNNCSCVF